MLIKRLPITLCIFGFILMVALITPYTTVQAATQAAVVSSTAYLNNLGYCTVVGEVQNTGDVALGSILVTAAIHIHITYF